ncbi:MAG: HAD-IA family hydrolase [Pseudonocardia sp.]|nr:HAD-IA family hydrolase [Pseudonocardia sp.]
MSAILFGSISTVADTSELQRAAFNGAFAEHGLNWTWDRDDYRAMLATSGGRSRIAEYARARGQAVDAEAVHATKSALFQKGLAGAAVPRPGVVETIRRARAAGVKVGLVTTTAPENVAALLDALGPDIGRDDFDVVVDAAKVEQPKPDAAAYEYALHQLGEDAASAVAVEDNVGGVRAAVAADLTCVAFPNANTAGHEFPGAARVVDHLEFAELGV